MSETLHTFKWYMPTSIRSRESYYEFDITSPCKTFFGNPDYVSRKIEFDVEYKVDQDFIDKVQTVKIRIFPFTIAPMSNNKEANLIIKKEVDFSPEFEHIFERGNLRLAYGLVVVEITFLADQEYTENLKLHEETDIRKVLAWNMDFEHMVMKLTTLTKDICAFFLLGLHLTFPTIQSDLRSRKGQSMGLIALTGQGTYIKDIHTDILSYPLLLEDKGSALKINLADLAEVWHKDVWSFHRFIKAVQSDHTTIDQFLDLVFTLESFFDKNTSTETMRLVAAALVGSDKEHAKQIDQLLADCFLIRNEVVHGGVHYRLHDDNPRKPKNGQRARMIMELFWDFKNLNIALLHIGIRKLILDRNPIPAKSIRFSTADIIDKVF